MKITKFESVCERGYLQVDAIKMLKYFLHENKDQLTSKEFNAESFLAKIWDIQKKATSQNITEFGKNIFKDFGISNYNLIPSDNKGACHAFCLAIASGTFGEKHYPSQGKIGFKGMMLKVIHTWLKCLKTNQETLILTKDWKQEEFNNLYKPIIDTYCTDFQKKVFIVVVNNSSIYLAYSS